MLALFTFAAIVFFVDQASKRGVQAHLTGAVSWGRMLQIRHVRHSQQLYKRAVPRIALVVIWVAALVSAAWLHKSGQWLQTRFAMASIGCALGGAAGNLIDILRRQQVTDFIGGYSTAEPSQTFQSIVGNQVVRSIPHSNYLQSTSVGRSAELTTGTLSKLGGERAGSPGQGRASLGSSPGTPELCLLTPTQRSATLDAGLQRALPATCRAQNQRVV